MSAKIELEDRLVVGLSRGEKWAFEELAGVIAQNVLQSIPAVVATLTQRSSAMQKVWKDFYNENPEFERHQGIVSRIVEREDANNPGKDYKRILDLARPKISEAIRNADKLRRGTYDVQTVAELDRSLGRL